MSLVLLVEVDHPGRAAMTESLRGLGHVVLPVGSAFDALRAVSGSDVAVVVLGPELPDMHGSEALRLVRGASDVPVIVMTSRSDARSTARLLDAGADDHLVEPFPPERLDARIAAVLRRPRSARPSALEPIAVGELRIDVDRREATLAAVPLTLTPREFDLLAYLARHRGRVVPKAELGREVWHRPGGRLDQTLDVHLSWLRRKLGETASTPRYLRRVHGVGIKLVEPQA